MRRLAALLALCLALGGCALLPGEERGYVLTLGLRVHGSAWQAVAQLPDYKGEGGYQVLSASGGTLREALAALDAQSPSRLHFGQLRLLILDRETASSSDLAVALRGVSHLRDVRMRAQLLVTEDDLAALLGAMQPESGSRLSKYLDVLLRARVEEGLLPGTTLSDWRRAGEREDPLLGSAALEKAENAAPAAVQGGQGDAGDQAEAGGTAEPNGRVSFGGSWLLGADGRLGEALTPRQTQLLMLSEGRGGSVTYRDGENCAVLRPERAAWVLRDGAAEGTLLLRAEVETGTAEGVRAALEKELTALLTRVCRAPADPLGLTGRAVLAGMEETSFRASLPALGIRVTVQLRPQP